MYNIIVKQKKPLYLLPCFMLLILIAGCGGRKDALQNGPMEVSGAKSGVFATLKASNIALEIAEDNRPSAALGMFVSLYIGQKTLTNVHGALKGIDSQIKMVRADSSIERDETFVLLEEYGTVLQVDIIDTLNRATDSEESLTGYTRSLESMNRRIVQKIDELSQKQEFLEDRRKKQRSVVRKLDRDVNRSLKDEEYFDIGRKQENLTKAKKELAETESRESELKRIVKAFKKLLKIGEKRLTAITLNHEITVAGLKVIDVPGIDDLGLILDD